MEIQKTDAVNLPETSKRIEHPIFEQAAAVVYVDELQESTMDKITAFLLAVPEVDWPADTKGNIAAYLKTVDEDAQGEVMSFVNYTYETGPAFKITDEDNLLLEKGELAYGRWKNKEGRLDEYIGHLETKASELMETYMFEEDLEISASLENKLNNIRVILNGVMNAARLKHDGRVFKPVKGALSGMFGLDLRDGSWN